MESSGEQEKKSTILCEDGIEQTIPWDHHLPSLGKPHDAKPWSSG